MAAPNPTATDDSLQAIAPGLLRIGAGALTRAAGWTLVASARCSASMVTLAADPREFRRACGDLAAAAELAAAGAQAYADGTSLVDSLTRWGLPALKRAHDALERGAPPAAPGSAVRLRAAGEGLLRRSRDVWSEDDRHPAYAGILRDLAPDEARVMVFLLKDGPQPCVDVIRSGLLGRLQSERQLARGLTMIGARASVRCPETLPQYLNNLTRLGLIWNSREPVADLLRYQVLEAQPDVLAALHSVRKATTVRRSIHLTPFGQDFARVCFANADEFRFLPPHEVPTEAVTEAVLNDGTPR